jgi:hypothetical protein
MYSQMNLYSEYTKALIFFFCNVCRLRRVMRWQEQRLLKIPAEAEVLKKKAEEEAAARAQVVGLGFRVQAVFTTRRRQPHRQSRRY